MQNNLLYAADFAKMLKITPATVSNWIKNKLLPENSVIDLGRKLIRRSVIEKYYDINLDNILTFEDVAEKLRTTEGNVKVLFSRKRLPSFLKTKIIGVVRIKGDIFNKFIDGE